MNYFEYEIHPRLRTVSYFCHAEAMSGIWRQHRWIIVASQLSSAVSNPQQLNWLFVMLKLTSTNISNPSITGALSRFIGDCWLRTKKSSQRVFVTCCLHTVETCKIGLILYAPTINVLHYLPSTFAFTYLLKHKMFQHQMWCWWTHQIIPDGPGIRNGEAAIFL